MKEYAGNGNITSPILNLSIRWGEFSGTYHGRFSPRKGVTGSNCKGGWVAPGILFGYIGEQINIFLSPRINLQILKRPSYILVPILPVLSWFLNTNIWVMLKGLVFITLKNYSLKTENTFILELSV